MAIHLSFLTATDVVPKSPQTWIVGNLELVPVERELKKRELRERNEDMAVGLDSDGKRRSGGDMCDAVTVTCHE